MYSRVLLLLFLIVCSALAFDKSSITRKGKRDPFEKHPISRRVLRFERSVVEKEPNYPVPMGFPDPMMDFAKVLPDLPVKFKPSQQYADSDFNPEMDF